MPHIVGRHDFLIWRQFRHFLVNRCIWAGFWSVACHLALRLRADIWSTAIPFASWLLADRFARLRVTTDQSTLWLSALCLALGAFISTLGVWTYNSTRWLLAIELAAGS